MSIGKRALKRLQTMEAGEDLLAGDLAHDVQANTESDGFADDLVHDVGGGDCRTPAHVFFLI